MFAPRRIGKTWLMNELAKDLRNEGWITIIVDVEGMRTEEEFLRALAEATASRGELADLPETGLALLDAGIEIASDNFGAATAHLDRALGAGLESEGWNFLDDLLRFFRLAFARGYGEKLIAHFEAAGHAERLAPVYAALVALVRGERHLLNFNPEARGPATKIYQSLVRPLRRADEGASQPGKTKRGRPRRPRSP
ncbi:MAG TPA: hypothetical protein VGL41_05950 [Roseiarcus sp.]